MTSQAEHFEVAQERDTVRRRAITTIGVVGVLVTLLAIAVSGLLLRGETRGQPAGGRVGPSERQIGIVDQTLFDVEDHGRDVREVQRRELTRYGWADRDAGVAIIPVEKAMDLIVERAR